MNFPDDLEKYDMDPIAKDGSAFVSESAPGLNRGLDPEVVLRYVVASACSLTRARYGGIVLMHQGNSEQRLVAYGFAAEEHAQLVNLLEREQLYEYFAGIQGLIRLIDLGVYCRELGLPVDLSYFTSFLAAPIEIEHEGVRTGMLFLSNKEDGREFSADDEKVALMMAAQASTIIAAPGRLRAHYDSRVVLQALTDASPVGVVIFDAKTGATVALNEETQRLVAAAGAPGTTLDGIIPDLTYRHGDGREMSDEDLPVSRVMRTGETVRGEEVVVQFSNGESVTALINAAPIYSHDGDMALVVVAFHDMTRYEELGRSVGQHPG